MRIKYYLRGIGVGIIFSVVIMSVSFSHRKVEEISDAEIIQRAKQLGMVEADKGDVSEKNIDNDKEAESNGKDNDGVSKEANLSSKIPVVEEKQKDKESQDELKKNEDKKQEEKVDEIRGSEEKTGGTIDSLVSSDNKTNVSKKDVTDKTNATDKKDSNLKEQQETTKGADGSDTAEMVTITIRSGQVCRQIAEELAQKGIVDDADKFREYMGRRGLASSIRCGTFEIPKGVTYQEVANYLINKQ